MKSKCCNWKMIVDSGDEGTSFYRCVKCGEACDPKVEKPKKPQTANKRWKR